MRINLHLKELMADRDIKMQKVIKKMKDASNAYKNRKSIIVLDTTNIQNIVITKKPTNITNKFDGFLICKALKMNNEKCTAKAKPNCDFCGRHKPK